MLQRHLKNERGVALAYLAIGMGSLMFVGLGVVGIDLARLAFTATEVQTMADVAATAGAKAYVLGGDAEAEGKVAVLENTVDGVAAEIAPPGTIVVGTYDFEDATFSAGGATPNAVKATAQYQVSNFLAGALDSLAPEGESYATSLVTKEALAAFGTICGGVPSLPVALGECHFPSDCTSGACSDVVTVPSPDDTAGFTGFFDNASASQILSFFPDTCNFNSDEDEIPPVAVGDDITLTNGNTQNIFRAIRCMICQLGYEEFLVPVVDQCVLNFNQTSTVQGFATIRIRGFNYANGNQTGPSLQSICNGPGGGYTGFRLQSFFSADVPGTPGNCCPTCGSGSVTMVGEGSGSGGSGSET